MSEKLEDLIQQREALVKWSEENGFVSGYWDKYNEYLSVTERIRETAPDYFEQMNAIDSFVRASKRMIAASIELRDAMFQAQEMLLRFAELLEARDRTE